MLDRRARVADPSGVRSWGAPNAGPRCRRRARRLQVALPAAAKRQRRQRVRLCSIAATTVPRGAWFTAPGSAAGKDLECARRRSSHTTALAQVPAPEANIAAVCCAARPRLGSRDEVAIHAIVTLWGGLPAQESWVLLLGPDRSLVEWARAPELGELRARDGLYQIHESLTPEEVDGFAAAARILFQAVLDEREHEWEQAVARRRDEELTRLSAFFASRVEEEEERSRRRTPGAEMAEMEDGDTVSLKLEWERRAAEIRQRCAAHRGPLVGHRGMGVAGRTTGLRAAPCTCGSGRVDVARSAALPCPGSGRDAGAGPRRRVVCAPG